MLEARLDDHSSLTGRLQKCGDYYGIHLYRTSNLDEAHDASTGHTGRDVIVPDLGSATSKII